MKTKESTVKVVDALSILNALPGSHLILSPDAPRFTIVSVTDSYLADTYLKRDVVIGQGVFEALTDDPANLEASGVKNLMASLHTVLEHKRESRMADQRYDVWNPQAGQWEHRMWRPLNKPVLNAAGDVQYIIHWVEDITEKTELEREAKQARQEVAERESRFRNMVEQAPVAITLTRGQDVVIESINVRMLQLMNQQPEESVIGKKMLEVLPELDGQPAYQRVQNVQKTGKPFRGDELPVDLMIAGKLERRYFNFSYTTIVEPEATTAVLHVAVDVTEGVKARKKIEEAKEELQMAIEIAELGTFLVDLDSNRASYSHRIRNWFGLKDDGLDMTTIFAVIHPQDLRRVVEAIQQSTTAEEISRHDITYRVVGPASGQERHVRSIGKAFFNSDGKAYQIRGIIQDVTVQTEHQQKIEESEARLHQRVLERTSELENLNKELKRSNANLEEFAHASSHDLKEPIRKIHFFTSQLKAQLGTRLKETEVRSFGRIENATERMSNLIDDLLLYSHASQRPRDMERVDLAKKMQRVLEDLELNIQEKGAIIQIGPLPVVHGYPRQLQQLFQNLISNALKYSKAAVAPHIDITATVNDEGENPYHIIKVKDNGIGFHQEYADKIFQIFTRLHAKDEYSGTGVGLSIVRKIVDNHDGFVRAESTPEEGATFIISLPAKNQETT